MPVSVVVAAYNEAPRLATALDRVCSALDADPGLDWELIVVDDGSSDSTATILQGFSAGESRPVSVLSHERNRGLNQAMRTGAAAARHPTIVFLDADLSYAPEIVGRLARAREATGAALAIASPYMRGGRTANVPLDRLVASRAANVLLSFCAGGRVKTFTGMVRAYDTGLARTLLAGPSVGEFNAWALAEVVRRNGRIVEIPAALVWPPARSAERGRMSLRTLLRRTRLVWTTLRIVRSAFRTYSGRPETGTLDLIEEATVPYSLL